MSAAEVFRSECAKGSSIGATIEGGFGAVWLAMGMANAGVPVRVAIAIVVPMFVLIACLGATLRRRLPKLSGPESAEKQMMGAFAVLNVVQWMAIFGTVRLLTNWHLEGWIVSAIMLIVGAHFLPLARIFGSRQHVVTGAALMLCAVVAVVLPASARNTVECVSAGVILWVSAAVALYSGFRLAPSSRLAAPARATF